MNEQPKKLLIFIGAGFSAALAPLKLLTTRQIYDKLVFNDRAMINNHDIEIVNHNKQEARELRHRIFFYLDDYFEKFFHQESKRVNIEALAVQINKCIEAVKQLDYSTLPEDFNCNEDVILQTQRQTDDSLREKEQRAILHQATEEILSSQSDAQHLTSKYQEELRRCEDTLQNQINRNNGSSNLNLRLLRGQWQECLDYINQYVLKELLQVKLKKEQVADYKEFIKALQDEIKFNIFTTNYDTVIRQVQDYPHCHLENGDEVDIEVITGSKQNPNGYCYIPLKGMLDWGFIDDENTIKQGSIPDKIEKSVVMTLEENNRELDDLQYPHNQLYGKFQAELQEANCLLFVGFAFNDDLVNQLIKEQIDQDDSENPKIQKVTIINQQDADNGVLQDKIRTIFATYKGELHIELPEEGFDLRVASSRVQDFL